MAMLGTEMELIVDEGVHVAGVRNEVCDGLSRDKSPSEFGLSTSQCLDINDVEGLVWLLDTCNPLRATNTFDNFVDTWRRTRRVCQLLSAGASCS